MWGWRHSCRLLSANRQCEEVRRAAEQSRGWTPLPKCALGWATRPVSQCIHVHEMWLVLYFWKYVWIVSKGVWGEVWEEHRGDRSPILFPVRKVHLHGQQGSRQSPRTTLLRMWLLKTRDYEIITLPTICSQIPKLTPSVTSIHQFTFLAANQKNRVLSVDY